MAWNGLLIRVSKVRSLHGPPTVFPSVMHHSNHVGIPLGTLLSASSNAGLTGGVASSTVNQIGSGVPDGDVWSS
jgi:hypothetical protein